MQGHNAAYWAYKMISTDHPLEEKIVLFWHGIFATSELKLNNVGSLTNQIGMFRRCGLRRFDNLLLELSQDPAMRVVVGWKGSEKKGASTSEMGRFETELLTQEYNLKGIDRLNVE